jgi:hypothetical protein
VKLGQMMMMRMFVVWSGIDRSGVGDDCFEYGCRLVLVWMQLRKALLLLTSSD